MGEKIAGLFEGPGLGLTGEGFEVLKHGWGFDALSAVGQRPRAFGGLAVRRQAATLLSSARQLSRQGVEAHSNSLVSSSGAFTGLPTQSFIPTSA
jgi:hypothetical protein